jgi:hypothetical protein
LQKTDGFGIWQSLVNYPSIEYSINPLTSALKKIKKIDNIKKSKKKSKFFEKVPIFGVAVTKQFISTSRFLFGFLFRFLTMKKF